MRKKLLISSLVFTLTIAACGIVPYRTARNNTLCPQSSDASTASENNECLLNALGTVKPPFHVSRAREQFQDSDKDLPKAFVGLAMSGGGSRAANFSLAVMEQLENLGFMRHVTAISSTSGGGLAGAYYSLKGPEIDWKAARTLMRTDFLSKWVFSNLRPDNLISTSLTHEDRSDLMADIFDDVLFSNATYSSLGVFGPGRPIFLANATHASRGERFTFTDEVFRRDLRSRLDNYPISQAVMASAAFPGVFNSVSLKRYPSLTSPNSTSPSIPVGYEHLLDGGPTDNLGIESLVALAASHQSSFERNNPNGSSQAPCFIFVADAYPPGISGKKAWTPDPRGFVDHFVDMNFLDAFDALLRRRRLDLLAYVGLGESPEVSDNRFIGDFIQPLSVGNLGSDSIRPALQLVEVDIPKQFLDSRHGWSRIRAVEGSFRKSWFTGAPASPPVPNGYFRCTVWHLNLAGVLDLKPFVKGADNQPARLRNDDSGRNSPMLQHRAKLKRLVSQIDTNFKLSGPENCSKDFLQDAIYASAFVVTREDHYNRAQVCDWFEKSGLSTSRECKLFPGNQSLQLQLDILPSGQLIAERPGDTAVQCKKQ